MNIEKYFLNARDCQKNQKIDMAVTLYHEILDHDPKHLPSLFNLATIHGERGEFAQAQSYYDQVIALEPDYVKAYYNNAICLLQQKNIPRAHTLLEQAVALVPEYAAAQHLLGSLLFKQGLWQEAKNHLIMGLQQDPDNAEMLNHLGMACLHLGELDDAELFLKKSIELMPYLAEAQYHLGVIHLKRGQFEEAQQRFQETIDRDPKHFGAWYNLGLMHKQQGFLKLSDECFAQAQAIQPDSDYVAFLRAAVNHTSKPEHPPEGFVQDLFDRYAGYYDAQMKEGIDYHVPRELYRCFHEHVLSLRGGATYCAQMVDLGCGTGLTGELFRPNAKYLIGLDISSEMLAKAREKNIYDDLQQGDILDLLGSKEISNVDVFIAADVLGYIGVLDDLFSTIYDALKPEGYWAFTIELGEEEITLSERIRFTHSAHYIEQLCDHLGFRIVQQEEIDLRKDIRGMIFIVQKS